MRVVYYRDGSAPWPVAAASPPDWKISPCGDLLELTTLLDRAAQDVVLVELNGKFEDFLETFSRLRIAAGAVPVVVAAPAHRENEAAAAVAAGAVDYWLDSMTGRRLAVTLEQASLRGAVDAAGAAVDEALERVEDAVVILDRGHRIIHWNRAAQRVFGFERTDMIGRSASEALLPLWVDPKVRLQAWRALIARGVWNGETMHGRRSGPPVRIAVELSWVRDSVGRRMEILLVARRATVGKAAAESGNPSPAFLERLLNSVPDPIFAKDRNHRLVYVNDAFCAHLGRSRDELLGTIEDSVIPPDQLKVFHAEDDKVFASGRDSVNEELLTDALGHIHVMSTKKTLWVDELGNPLLVGVARDMTELSSVIDRFERGRQRLRHSQKLEAIGRLATGLAHDFNNVFTAISGCAQLLEDGLPPPPTLREELAEIQKAVARGSALTTQMFAFGRRRQDIPQVVDLRDIYGGMKDLVRRLLSADIDLIWTLPDKLAPVRVDLGQAEQVLLNLVVDVGDMLPAGGRIHVALAEEMKVNGVAKLCVTLTVRAEGSASPDRRPEKGPGNLILRQPEDAGAGLAAIQDLVTLAGGTAEVESSREKGVTYRVWWPIAGSAGLTTTVPRRLRAMVVDDDAAVRRFATRTLENAGIDVVSAADAAEALRLGEAEEGALDVLVIDVVLPRLPGPELVKRLRRHHPTASVLFISGMTPEAAALEHDADRRSGFLSKPFTSAALSQKVRDLIAP